jgi:hypothetical protein
MKFNKKFDYNEFCIIVNGYRFPKKEITLDGNIHHDRFIFTQEGNNIFVEDLMNETCDKIGSC